MSKLILVDASNGSFAMADGHLSRKGTTFDLELFRNKPALEVTLKSAPADELTGKPPTLNYIGVNKQSAVLKVARDMANDITFIGIYVATGLSPNYRMYIYATPTSSRINAKKLGRDVLDGLRSGAGIPKAHPVLEVCQPFNRQLSLALLAIANA